MKAVFVIPVYNHGATLDSVVSGLLHYNLPVIVVDDGNDEYNRAFITRVAEKYTGAVIPVRRNKNGGKGKAMSDGVRKAWELGFTHVFQMDADGQHDSLACAAFLEAAGESPASIICGYPDYDDSVPLARRKGREFANMWARFVTLDGSIKDVLCGFRVYPVKPYMELLRHHAVIDSRMGYDADILVRLMWKGVSLRQLPVRVTYPADGISNFRMVRDNIHISLTYTRLCAGLLLRLPLLALRRFMAVRKDDGSK